jgi:hypothetical protein
MEGQASDAGRLPRPTILAMRRHEAPILGILAVGGDSATERDCTCVQYNGTIHVQSRHHGRWGQYTGGVPLGLVRGVCSDRPKTWFVATTAPAPRGPRASNLRRPR